MIIADVKQSAGYVLVALDLSRPQFFCEHKGIQSGQPFLEHATVFALRETAEQRRTAVLGGGGRNIPPFEVMSMFEAAKLPSLHKLPCAR